jgi:hypothetical protein
MKKLSVVLGVAASVSLIVLSLLVPVNRSVSPPSDRTLQIADGTPMPPIPPPPPPPSGS